MPQAGSSAGGRGHRCHVAVQEIPDLRQLVDARSAQEGADPWQARGGIAEPDLAMALAPCRRVGNEMGLEPCLGITIHGAKLPHPDCLAAIASALAGTEHRPWIDQLDRRRED